MGLDIFKIKTTYADESSYDNNTIGTGFRLGYMITERTRHSWNYSYKDDKLIHHYKAQTPQGLTNKIKERYSNN